MGLKYWGLPGDSRNRKGLLKTVPTRQCAPIEKVQRAVNSRDSIIPDLRAQQHVCANTILQNNLTSWSVVRSLSQLPRNLPGHFGRSQ